MSVINLNDTTPAAPVEGSPASILGINVKWQADDSVAPRNVSAYVPLMVGDDDPSSPLATPEAGAVPAPAPGDAAAGKFLKADGAWERPTDVNLLLSDVTTNNVSTTEHGFAPKAPNDVTKFLDGTGAYSHPTDADLSISDITTNNVSITEHGFAPKAPNDATKFLDGTGAYSNPPGGTVTHTGGSLSADQPVFGAGGADLKAGTKSGNTDEVVTQSGAATPGRVLLYDANGNAIASSILGNTTTVQMASGAGTSGYPLLYDASGNAIARQPRGNTTVVQLADSTTAPTSGNAAAFDANGNVKDAGVAPAQSSVATAHEFLSAYNAATGAFTQAQPADADLSVSDVTTNNVSTTKHGFAPKAPNDATKYLDGTGAYSVPPSGGAFGGITSKSANYTAASGDSGKLIVFTAAATLTLPATPPSSTWAAFVANDSTGSVNVSGGGSAYPSGWTVRQTASIAGSSGAAMLAFDETAATATSYSGTITASTTSVLFAIMCALKPSGASAPAYVQGAAKASSTNSSVYTASFASPNTAGNCLVLDVFYISNSFGGVGIPTITDSQGNTWTLVAGGVGTAGSTGGTMPYYGTFVAPNCAGGANTVTLTSSLLCLEAVMELHEYSGVVTSSPIDVSQAVNSTSATTQTPSVTTTGTNRTLHLAGMTYANNLAVGAQIDGTASSLILAAGQGVYVTTDGTNYFTERGTGSGGSSTVPTATTSVLGIVKPDGATIDVSSGVISVPTATTSLLGLVKPDGSTVTIAGGVISAAAGAVSSLTTTGSSGAATLSGGVLNIPQYSGGGGGSGAGALVLLEQHTASGSAELDFTSWYSSAYDEYIIEVLDLIPATNGVYCYLQCSTNGGSSYDSGADYNYGRYYVTTSAGGATGNSNSQTQDGITLWDTDLSNSSSGGMVCSIRFFDPANTSVYKKFQWSTYGPNSGGAYYAQTFMGHFRSTSAVNAFRIILSSGNIASGTVRIYGLSNTTGAGGANCVLISDQLLGSPASSISFPSVAGYKHLKLFITGRNSGANNDDGVVCYANGDTTNANYEQEYMVAYSGNSEGATASSPLIAQLPGTSTGANTAASCEISFPNYGGTTFYKGAVLTSGYRSGSTYQLFWRWWEWHNTAAITSLVLSMQSGGNFVAGSRFTLYGMS